MIMKESPKVEEIENQLVEKFKITNPVTDMKKTIKEFKLKNSEVGHIVGSEHSIVLTNKSPVQCKPYAVPYKFLYALKEEIESLEEKGIIQKTRSLFSTPTFVLVKKNDRIKLVHDYVRLNRQAVKYAFPFPSVFDQFSVLDLDCGFYQIPIKKEDCYKTAFSVRSVIMNTNACRLDFVMHQGRSKGLCLICFLNTNQRVSLLMIYLSRAITPFHTQRKLGVLEKLSENGAKVNFSKSQFGKSEIKYLEIIVNKGGLRADIEKVNLYKK